MSAAPMAPGSGKAPPPVHRPARVLIAEDDPGMRETLAPLGRGLGYEAVTVADGEAALQAVAATPPDLLLSGIAMPA